MAILLLYDWTCKKYISCVGIFIMRSHTLLVLWWQGRLEGGAGAQEAQGEEGRRGLEEKTFLNK